jgi:apolipoprotein N-acyltransferase
MSRQTGAQSGLDSRDLLRDRKVSYPLAVLSGVLLVLTFPDANFHFLAPVALVPLLVVVTSATRLVERFLLGWACGVTYWLGVCYWIQFTLAQYGEVNVPLSVLALILFGLAKGLHMAAFGLAAGWLMQRWWAIPATAAAWVAIERTHGPLGFAWLALGNAGIDMDLLMRTAPLVGVYGLSFLFLMMNAAMALVALRRSRKELLWIAVLPLLWFLPALPAPEQGNQDALLVQPNILDEDKWTIQSVHELEERVLALSSLGLRTINSPGEPLVLWPEVPAPIHYYDDATFRRMSHEFAERHKAWFLFGTIGRTPDLRAKNTAVMINPEGKFAGDYDKMFLVPFGEFVPPLFEWVGKVSDYAGNFVPGDRVVVFPVRDHKLSAIICYESAFPHLVRRFVKEGAEVIANLSFDGYFGDSSARGQHLLLARMRAAENGRWLLRATSDGTTASIDPAGRLVDTLTPRVAAALPARFSYRDQKTPYTRYGDWFCLVCAMVALGGIALELRAVRQSKN